MNRLRAFLSLGSIAITAGVVGIAGTAYGAYNSYENSKKMQSGTGGGVSGSNTYVPTGQPGADQGWQAMLQQMLGGASDASSAISPELLKSFESLMGIDTSGLTQAGNAAGAASGVIAGDYSSKQAQMQQQAVQDFAAQQRLQTAGDQLWNTAQDPQNALAAKMQQQVTDASRAGTSARGIGMSGNAAGVENQAVGDFLMNWQNQQLQRQATGLQGMQGAYGQGNALGQAGNASIAGSADLSSMIPQLLMMSGQLPYGANVQAAGAPMQYGNMYANAQGTTNNLNSSIMSQIIPYLYQGMGATGQQFGQNQTNLNNQTSAIQQMMKLFGGGSGGGLSGLSSLFGGGQPSQTGNNYGNDLYSVGPPSPDVGAYTG